MKLREVEKYAKILQKGKIKCICGHSIIMPPQMNKKICRWCGNYVFKSKKDEFEYRLIEAMHNEVENKKLK